MTSVLGSCRCECSRAVPVLPGSALERQALCTSLVTNGLGRRRGAEKTTRRVRMRTSGFLLTWTRRNGPTLSPFVSIKNLLFRNLRDLSYWSLPENHEVLIDLIVPVDAFLWICLQSMLLNLLHTESDNDCRKWWFHDDIVRLIIEYLPIMYS